MLTINYPKGIIIMKSSITITDISAIMTDNKKYAPKPKIHPNLTWKRILSRLNEKFQHDNTTYITTFFIDRNGKIYKLSKFKTLQGFPIYDLIGQEIDDKQAFIKKYDI